MHTLRDAAKKAKEEQ